MGERARPRGKSADATIWRISKQKGLGQPAQTYLGRKNRGPYWKPGGAGGGGCTTLFRAWARWALTSDLAKLDRWHGVQHGDIVFVRWGSHGRRYKPELATLEN
jgi:hypothetical protein